LHKDAECRDDDVEAGGEVHQTSAGPRNDRAIAEYASAVLEYARYGSMIACGDVVEAFARKPDETFRRMDCGKERPVNLFRRIQTELRL
jgi:hypothetical protein